MKIAGRMLVVAAPLFGCGGSPTEPTGGSSESGGSSSTGSGEPTTSGTSGGETSGGETSGGETASSSESSSAGESSSTGGSTGDADTSTGAAVEPAPDFGLVDVNPNSASFDAPVSPRDYLERVSGWYFAHAT